MIIELKTNTCLISNRRNRMLVILVSPVLGRPSHQQAIINKDTTHQALNARQGHKRSYPKNYFQQGHNPPGYKYHTGTQA